MNPISIRLLNQQLYCPQFSEPKQVVSHFGAIQAQEYRMMRWAVEMRTKHPSHRAFQKAFDSGEIIRMHLLRGTWQLISGEDYPWMLSLCAEKAMSVINGWMSANKISIPKEEYLRVSEIIGRATADLGSVTKEDLVEALSRQDITMDDHRLSYHIRMGELTGLLCSGNLHPSRATYSLASEKLNISNPQFSKDEALALLARKYFQSHQPATLEDFVWWSGLNISDCRKAITLLGDELIEENFKGRTFYLTDSCKTRGFSSGRTLLISPYDEYLIGYKSRDIVLSKEFSHLAHNNSGIFYPVIAHDGVICGNWTPHKKEANPTFFEGMKMQDCSKSWELYSEYKKRI
ncbi:MAG: winged helix DNA-binding domain-containing protein [Bacteroidales bacterium]|nr:winged helix DNA-binding domain-containing protein [Bacteroidales bacterium]